MRTTYDYRIDQLSICVEGDDHRLGDLSLRYRLTQLWGDGPRVCFVMLNPSTADAHQDDPTLTRCTRFAHDIYNAGSLDIVNLYAYRTPNPDDLKRLIRETDDYHGLPGYGHYIVSGQHNELYIGTAVTEADVVVAAWGFHADTAWVRHHTSGVLDSVELVCLGTTKDGAPRHPLMLKSDTRPRPWRPRQ